MSAEHAKAKPCIDDQICLERRGIGEIFTLDTEAGGPFLMAVEDHDGHRKMVLVQKTEGGKFLLAGGHSPFYIIGEYLD